MIFTREDILKIQNALLQLGRKDSEFKDADTPLNSDDEIAILQDGINKKVSINNLLSTLGLLKKDDFINVSDRYDEYYIQLSEAITIIAKNKRKKGLVITFQDLKGDWKIYQFTGEISNFVKTELWKDLLDFKYPIVNSVLPDEEDLTLTYPDSEGNSFIQLKDKEYDPENFSGMATKILRKNIVEVGGVKKNILTQEDFDQENCVYEIKYEFDLNGQTITIPNKCVLDFRGGSFKSGTINGNLYSIRAYTKVFSGIKFTGKATRNLQFDLDWFVSQYVDGLYNSVSIDSSVEINEAISSGVRFIVFPNDKYYYLKNPIVVKGDVHLLSKTVERKYDTTFRDTVGHFPCVYSNEIITLLDYQYSSTEYQYGLTIGSISFYCRKPYSDLSDKDTPIVKITAVHSAGSVLWGLTFNADINAVDRQIDVPNAGGKYHIPSYTGLKIFAQDSAISYMKINGYIQMVHKAIDVGCSSSTWITDTTINGDTRAVFGGTFNGGTPVRVFGSHQPIYSFAEEIRGTGYFNSGWINIYGFVWDVGNSTANGTLRTVPYSAKLSSGGIYNSESNGLYPETYGPVRYTRNKTKDSRLVQQHDNFLNKYYIGAISSMFNLSYTANDVDILTPNDNFQLYNGFNLFNTNSRNSPHHKNGYMSLYHSSTCFLRCTSAPEQGLVTLKFHCELLSSLFDYQGLPGSTLRLVTATGGTAKVAAFKQEQLLNEIVYNISENDAYYDNGCFVFQFSQIAKDTEVTKVVIDLEFKFNQLGLSSLIQLPCILVPCSDYIWDSIPKLSRNPNISINNSGFSYFNTTEHRQLTHYNGEWYDSYGNPYNAIHLGTTENRPTNVKVGFYYFDTTINKPIWLKSTSPKEWVNANGEVV